MLLTGCVLLMVTLPSDDFHELKLLPGDNTDHEYFAWSIAISGSTAVIGKPGDKALGNYTGAFYLFDITTGQELSKHWASDGQQETHFGRSVAIDGTTVIAGAHTDDDKGYYSGSAYLFDTTTGQEIAKLLAADGGAGQRFGYSVGISGNTAIVGTPYDSHNGQSSGAAYLFDTATGQEIVKLLPSDGEAKDYFGLSVAIAGSTAIIGAPGDDDNGSNSGAAYVFDTITGQQFAKLTPADGEYNSDFGQSVAISGTVALIGAPDDSGTGWNAGAAYLFDTATGQELAKLTSPDLVWWEDFGESVAIHGDIAVVGDIKDLGIGAAYVFDTTTGLQIAKLTASDGHNGDVYGFSVATDGTTVLVGAIKDDDNGTDNGAAFLYHTPPPIGTNYCAPAQLNSSGQSGVITALGTIKMADNCVRLEAARLAAQQPALFLNSQAQGFINPPGAQGFLCLSGAIGLYTQAVQDTGSEGVASIELDLTYTPTPNGPVVVMPGETWNFQLWFRDMTPGPTSNFTDGVSVTFR